MALPPSHTGVEGPALGRVVDKACMCQYALDPDCQDDEEFVQRGMWAAMFVGTCLLFSASFVFKTPCSHYFLLAVVHFFCNACCLDPLSFTSFAMPAALIHVVQDPTTVKPGNVANLHTYLSRANPLALHPLFTFPLMSTGDVVSVNDAATNPTHMVKVTYKRVPHLTVQD